LSKEIIIEKNVFEIRVFCSETEKQQLIKYNKYNYDEKIYIIINILSKSINKINFINVNNEYVKKELKKLNTLDLRKIFTLYFDLFKYANKISYDLEEFCKDSYSKFIWNICKGSKILVNDKNITESDEWFPLNIPQKVWISLNQQLDEFNSSKIIIETQWKIAEYLFENLGLLLNPKVMRNYLQNKNKFDKTINKNNLDSMLQDMGEMMSLDDIERFITDIRSSQNVDNPLFIGYVRLDEEPIEDFIERITDDIYEKLIYYKNIENDHNKAMKEYNLELFKIAIMNRMNKIKNKFNNKVNSKEENHESTLIIDYTINETLGDDSTFNCNDIKYYEDILNEKFFTLLGNERFKIFEEIVGYTIELKTNKENELKEINNECDIDNVIKNISEDKRAALNLIPQKDKSKRIKHVLDKRDEALQLINNDLNFEDRKANFINELTLDSQIKGD
jgi:hypothetical protein